MPNSSVGSSTHPANYCFVAGRAGIGESIAKKLAGQGLNVVLMALQDEVLDATTAELKAAFPNVQLRKVHIVLWHDVL